MALGFTCIRRHPWFCSELCMFVCRRMCVVCVLLDCCVSMFWCAVVSPKDGETALEIASKFGLTEAVNTLTGTYVCFDFHFLLTNSYRHHSNHLYSSSTRLLQTTWCVSRTILAIRRSLPVGWGTISLFLSPFLFFRIYSSHLSFRFLSFNSHWQVSRPSLPCTVSECANTPVFVWIEFSNNAPAMLCGWK